MVDILGILGSLKGKVLDATHYDLLEHAYKLQQENVTQLKENNAALRESADLQRAELGRVKDRVAALERENGQLQAKVVTSAPASLSARALEILRWLVKHDSTDFYAVQAHAARVGSKLETEAALDELSAAKLIDVGSFGSERGAHYYLTNAGKRFVLTLGKS